MLLFLTIILGLLLAFYLLWINNYKYWESRGFPYLKPSFPYGNLKELVLFQRFQGDIYKDIYGRALPHQYIGLYRLTQPILLLRGIETIKTVLIKDFNYFTDRLFIRKNQLLGNHLFFLGGDKWRALRVKLTPTFTSGKLKLMFGLFQACSNQLDSLIEEVVSREEPVDIKDLIAKYTTDTIGSCAFGLDINTISHPDSEFRKIAKKIFPTQANWKLKIKLALLSVIPSIFKIFGFEARPNGVSSFIFSLVKETVEYREKHNFKRNDFLDLLIELKNQGRIERKNNTNCENSGGQSDASSIEMTMDVLAAQCYIFIIAGFETSSSVQTNCLYELALNQEIQDKLRKEILEAIDKHEELTYDAIMEMSFLDQVISETMRKYPTLPVLMRHCTKDYQMPDTGLTVEKGTMIIIPVYALHHDPNYFPDPEKFDPNRFGPERKTSIPHYTYLPFGEGPRHCIGMRFGLLQTKMGLCTVLKKYKLYPCKETVVPLKFNTSLVISTPACPIKLLIQKCD